MRRTHSKMTVDELVDNSVFSKESNDRVLEHSRVNSNNSSLPTNIPQSGKIDIAKINSRLNRGKFLTTVDKDIMINSATKIKRNLDPIWPDIQPEI